jgi:beta-lactamase class A
MLCCGEIDDEEFDHAPDHLGATLTALVPPRLLARAEAGPEGLLAELEAGSGGRLGVVVLDTASGVTIRHRAEERFAMCSTFKFLAAAAVLARVDRGSIAGSRSPRRIWCPFRR